ncbi:hypothetical protein ACW6QP_14940 [Salegentibacter sp. HM20]
MFKTLLGFLLLLLLGTSIWYFFIKFEDYSIGFNHSFDEQNLYLAARQGNLEELNLKKINKEEAYKKLNQDFSFGFGEINLQWNFNSLKDSLERVEIKVKHREDNFQKRFQVLFGKPEFQKQVVEAIENFRNKMEAQDEIFRIKIEETTTSPATQCICKELQAKPEQKAREMMQSISILSSFVEQNGLKSIGRPRILMQIPGDLSQVADFEFCFPLERGQKIPELKGLKLKEIEERKGLKAIYNGNYMFSHLAWSYVFEYAKMQNLDYQPQLLEVYNSNPQMGGDALEWEAEIYLFLK